MTQRWLMQDVRVLWVTSCMGTQVLCSGTGLSEHPWWAVPQELLVSEPRLGSG